MQKIVLMEHELTQQSRYLNDTVELYEDKLQLLEAENKEILERELKGIKKIKDLNEKLNVIIEMNQNDKNEITLEM